MFPDYGTRSPLDSTLVIRGRGFDTTVPFNTVVVKGFDLDLWLAISSGVGPFVCNATRSQLNIAEVTASDRFSLTLSVNGTSAQQAIAQSSSVAFASYCKFDPFVPLSVRVTTAGMESVEVNAHAEWDTYSQVILTESNATILSDVQEFVVKGDGFALQPYSMYGL